MTAFLFLLACAPKHPDLALRRVANRQNRELSKATPAALADDLYAVPVRDAVAVAAEQLEITGSVVDVSSNGVGTDWTWSGSSDVDLQSEYYDQRRTRSVVQVEEVGPEVRIVGEVTSGVRRARPDGIDAWSDGVAPLDVSAIQGTLAKLESGHLAHLIASGPEALDVFEATLPAGYVVVERTDAGLRAESIATSGKAGTKGATASWDARETLTVGRTEHGVLWVTFTKDDRFTAAGTTSPWEPATVSDAPAIDWAHAALRRGHAPGHLEYRPQLKAVEDRDVALSQPPPVPKVRTLEEVRAIVTARAIEQGAGRFNVCLDVILVNPRGPDGTTWDLGGVDAVLQVVGGTANLAAGALGEINRVADSIPLAGDVLDLTVDYYSGGTVDRHHAELIATITGQVAGWALKDPAFAPDVIGSYSVGSSTASLASTQDRLESPQNLCGTGAFASGGPTMTVQVFDQDVNVSDPIGTCTYSLLDILREGGRGIPCGYARVFPSAEFLFDLDQIEVVGLPPPPAGDAL